MKDPLAFLGRVVDASPADQTQAVLLETRNRLTRFTHSAIHQNVSEENGQLLVQVLVGRRSGTVSTNVLTEPAARDAVAQAIEIARRQQDLPWEVKLPSPSDAGTPVAVDGIHRRETAECTAEHRARVLDDAFRRAAARGTTLMGALSTNEAEVSVRNSHGVAATGSHTMAEASVFARKEQSFGYAYRRRRSVNDLGVPELEEIASEKALRGVAPRALPPGRYDVLLEPAAVATLFEWLSFVSFGARSVDEGSSFLAGNEGKAVLGPNATFYDDGLEDPETAMPFDLEGVARRRVVLVDRGVARGAVTDSFYASRERKASTGHSMGPGSQTGPVPVNLSLEAGATPRSEMLRRLGRGLVVTRFHYVNGLLEPRQARFTGMTKDGTFFVEGGEIVSGVENLRFTEALVEAFRRIDALSAERERIHSWWGFAGGYLVPALLIRDFAFTGKA